MERRKYSVLLIYPWRLIEDTGDQTWLAHTFSESPEAAIREAQAEAYHSTDLEEDDRVEASDFTPALVIHGHHERVDFDDQPTRGE